MKIALIKTECSVGDKVTIHGKVKWVGVKGPYDGQQGPFYTESVLVADGPQDDQKTNSIFCSFFQDSNQFTHCKDQNLSLSGTVDEYQGKRQLKGCKDAQGPPANNPPQSTPQGQTSPQNRTQAPPARDYDKENRGKCRFGFYNTLIGSIGAAGLLANPAELAAVEMLIEYSMNGYKPQQESFNQFAKNADQQDNIPPVGGSQLPADDDIPF
jgi:hypothetical protein